MFENINNIITSLNGSKYFAGVMMILLNIGGKQISKEISFIHEKIMNNRIIRRLFVFVAVFIATKDIKISLIVTALFVLIITGFLHEDSNYCLLPEKIVKSRNKINKDEYLRAKQIVENFENN